MAESVVSWADQTRGHSGRQGSDLLAVETSKELRVAGRKCADDETTQWPGPDWEPLVPPRARALPCATEAHPCLSRESTCGKDTEELMQQRMDAL